MYQETMRFRSFLILLSGLTLIAFSTASFAGKGGKKKTHHPIEIEFTSPVPPKGKGHGKGEKSRAIQFRSGWPLTLKLSTTDKHLQGVLIMDTNAPHGVYPEAGVTSALVFEDPDNCLSIGGRATGPVVSCPPDPDEVFLEFTPDVDFPGLLDLPGHGRADIHNRQDFYLPRPEWGGPLLPVLEEGSSDGVGYGPNDDLPGLVIISNVGVGIVYAPLVMENRYPLASYPTDCAPECSFQLVDPRPVDWRRAGPDSGHPDFLVEGRHNLSGLMGEVAYELNDQDLRTTITTGLVVPRYLFSHQVLQDNCYSGDASDASCDDYARIVDGGPVIIGHPFSSDPTGFDIQTSYAEIRAFVVNGDAPNVISECDGEHGVTAADIECNINPDTGYFYTLISNEAVLEVEQRGGEIDPCNYVTEPWGPVFIGAQVYGRNIRGDADFDLNTPEIDLTAECPGGGGGTTKPPR